MSAMTNVTEKNSYNTDMMNFCSHTVPSLPCSGSDTPRYAQGIHVLRSSTSPIAAPTGPRFGQKAPSRPSEIYGACQNNQANFHETPSPEVIHRQVMHQKQRRHYYSITTIPLPFMPWKPLDCRHDMETRPCFRPASRIHLLTCGHHVAVRDSAEPCAANCSHSFMNISESVSIPARHATSILKIRANAVEGLRSYIDTRVQAGDSAAEHDYAVHLTAMSNVRNKQDASLQPTALLTDGNFECTLCGSEGERPTYPAFFLTQLPYACIVVGRNAHDLAVLHALRKGVMPRKPPSPKCGLEPQHGKGTHTGRPYRSFSRSNPGFSGRNVGFRPQPIHAGHRQSDGLVGSIAEHHAPEKKAKESLREEQERRRHGWLSKRRRAEKDEVLGRLREEYIVDGLETTSLRDL